MITFTFTGLITWLLRVLGRNGQAVLIPLLDYNWLEFSNGCYTKIKELGLPYYLPLAGSRIVGLTQ